MRRRARCLRCRRRAARRHVIEGAARFERAHKQNVEKDAARETERIGAGLRLIVMRDVEDGFFEEKLGAAGDCGARSRCRARSLSFLSFISRKNCGENVPRSSGPAAK